MGNYCDERSLAPERCEEVAKYIVVCGSTVRAAAIKFGMSKSTVHKEITTRLKRINPGLFSEVRVVLEKNKAERHLRGGEATKQRYESMREKGVTYHLLSD